MPKDTVEEYRLSLSFDGIRRKLLRHSVEEDETLLVQVRSSPRPKAVARLTAQGGALEIDEPHMSRRGLSYHPSGRINTKSHDGKHQDILVAPPLPLLKTPILLLFHSAASFDQFDLDTSKPRFGDHCVDLDGTSLRRIHAECLIGPKGSFKGEFVWPWGWGTRVVYEDAAFYDVCYLVGEGPDIPDHLEKNGIKIKETVFTGTLNQSLLPPESQEYSKLAPATWASPPAAIRQIRALFEHRYDRLLRIIGAQDGSYHVRMCMTSNGTVAALERVPTAQGPSAGWQVFASLDVDTVVQQVRGANGLAGLIDAHLLNPALTSGIAGSIYVAENRGVSARYPLVFVARQLLSNRYYRINPTALKNIDQLFEPMSGL